MDTRPLDRHTPVLLREVLDSLAAVQDRGAVVDTDSLNTPQGARASGFAGQVVLDCTAGLGGHASAIAERMVSESSPNSAAGGGGIALVDADAGNLALARERVEQAVAGRQPPVRVEALHGTFAAAPGWLRSLGLCADVVLADLGFCSNQIADAARGFSFQSDGPLDMRLNTRPLQQANAPGSTCRLSFTPGPSASELVNRLSERDLSGILREYGEESAARAIAAKIVRERAREPITTTGQLAEIVRSVVPRRPGGIDPATKTFQALRIAVNDELGALVALLEQIERAAAALSVPSGQAERSDASVVRRSWLAPGARIGIITFHSLEDRPVKQCFASLVEQGLAEHVTAAGRPIVAGEDETRSNPRSRSAKLRVIRMNRSVREGIHSPIIVQE